MKTITKLDPKLFSKDCQGGVDRRYQEEFDLVESDIDCFFTYLEKIEEFAIGYCVNEELESTVNIMFDYNGYIFWLPLKDHIFDGNLLALKLG